MDTVKAASGPRVTSAEVAQRRVFLKLVAFALSLAIVPIASYFVSLKYLWNDNATFAALTAVFAANLVLIGYITTSVQESAQIPTKPSDESKKDK